MKNRRLLDKRKKTLLDYYIERLAISAHKVLYYFCLSEISNYMIHIIKSDNLIHAHCTSSPSFKAFLLIFTVITQESHLIDLI